MKNYVDGLNFKQKSINGFFKKSDGEGEVILLSVISENWLLLGMVTVLERSKIKRWGSEKSTINVIEHSSHKCFYLW